MELSITFTTGTKSVETLLKSSQKKPGWYFGGSRGREDKAWTPVLTSRVLKRSNLRSVASHHHHHHIMIIKPPDSFKGQIVKCKVQIKRIASQLKHVLCYQAAPPGQVCCSQAWWSPPCSRPSLSPLPASLLPRSSASSPDLQFLSSL